MRVFLREKFIANSVIENMEKIKKFWGKHKYKIAVGTGLTILAVGLNIYSLSELANLEYLLALCSSSGFARMRR